MRGLDGADLFTHASLGKIPEQPYTDFLHEDSLRGARIGVLRDLFREGEQYADINGLIEKEIAVLIEQGAVVMDGLSTGIDLMDKYQLDALVYPFKGLTAPRLGTGDRGPRHNPVSAITGLPALKDYRFPLNFLAVRSANRYCSVWVTDMSRRPIIG